MTGAVGGPDIITRAIDALAGGHDLALDDAAAVLSEIMAGNASEIQIAAFLIALRTKGETVEELAGLARTMRSKAAQVTAASDELLDTAGTGGGRRTFNVSTTAALIAAGAGCTVAKHGNRSATGLSGSADVLEALGARIDLGPREVARCIDDVGFGFMFAPAHHQATKYVVPVRRQLAVRTIFNFLGPLTNPAGATRQLIGVSDPAYLETMAGALALLGTKHALLVSSEDGLDELSISAPTSVVEVVGGKLRRYTVAPEEVGLERAPAQDVPGGDPEQNAQTARTIFAGERGAPRDLAVLNAGAAIYAGGRAGSLEEGVRVAVRAVDEGSALAALERFVRRTRELAP
jgi:anthranilate phosphoribosyltransferase